MCFRARPRPSIRRLLPVEAVVFQFIVVHDLASLHHTPELLFINPACDAKLCDRRHRLDQILPTCSAARACCMTSVPRR
jgi:hypothetical protein